MNQSRRMDQSNRLD